MEHTIDIQNNIAYVKIAGNQNEAEAKKFVENADIAIKKSGDQKINAIVNLLESGLSDYKGLMIYKTFLEDNRLGKIAFVVTNPAVEGLTKLATTAKESDVGFFETQENAKKWVSN